VLTPSLFSFLLYHTFLLFINYYHINILVSFFFLILLSIKKCYDFVIIMNFKLKFIIPIGTPSILFYLIMETIFSVSHHILYYLYCLLIFFSSHVSTTCRVIYTLGPIFTRGFTSNTRIIFALVLVPKISIKKGWEIDVRHTKQQLICLILYYFLNFFCP